MTEDQQVARRLLGETLKNDERIKLGEESEEQIRRMKFLEQWVEKIQCGSICSPDRQVQHNREREQREEQRDQRHRWEDSKGLNH